MKEGAARDATAQNALGLNSGDQVDAHTLLRAFICKNAPDATLALAAGLAGTRNAALAEMRDLAADLHIKQDGVRNITGRKMARRPQTAHVGDVYRGAKHLFYGTGPRAGLLSIANFAFRCRTVYSPTRLLTTGLADECFMFGDRRYSGVARTAAERGDILTVALGALDEFHRDYVMAKTIAAAAVSAKVTSPAVQRTKLPVSDGSAALINIAGYDYLGEICSGHAEPTGEPGGGVKLESDFGCIDEILSTGHYNIAGVRVDRVNGQTSSGNARKPAESAGMSRKTPAPLHRAGIHAVMPAGDGTGGGGAPGLAAVLPEFERAGIAVFGAGPDAASSEKPLLLDAAGRTVAIYGGFWYQRNMHEKKGIYALGPYPGVACLSGGLIRNLEQFKAEQPDALALVCPHWGSQSGLVTRSQRKMARLLLKAGADLIIGYGGPGMQEMSRLRDKWVAYGIGSGMLEGDTRQASLYGFIAQLRVVPAARALLFLYPIFTGCEEPHRRARTVTKDEFREVLQLQRSQGMPVDDDMLVTIGRDRSGYYLAVVV